MVRVKKALLSVSDKKGIIKFARALVRLGVEIISTGGTASTLSKSRIPVKTIEQLTGSGELLNGRVKSLNPAIHGAILADRNNPRHIRELKRLYGIEPIDLVVVNLYPFEETIRQKGVTLNEAIEQIDIGGVTLLRSASKNFKNVASVSAPDRYDEVIRELKQNNGQLSDRTLHSLAIDAFTLTSRYDAMIAGYLEGGKQKVFTKSLKLEYEKLYDLRYGENPHQRAAFYKDIRSSEPGLAMAKKIQGAKELSFNNILDMDVALNIVSGFDKPCACIIKHGSPCGVATDKELANAYEAALECDRLSSYGGVVGLNQELNAKTAMKIVSSDFIEVVVAPEYTSGAINALKKRQNMRVISSPLIIRDENEWQSLKDIPLEARWISGGILLQQKDIRGLDVLDLKVVTRRKPENEELKDLIFAWKVVKFVKSNAIVLAKQSRTVGIGGGQPSRVGSVEIAVKNAGRRAIGASLASDAFFPMRDGVDVAAKAGITAIIQPGGSIRDKEVIQAANESEIAMIFTGIRHFRH